MEQGDLLIDKIRQTLSSAKGRTEDQERMQELFLASCARYVYGEVLYHENRAAILERNRWSSDSLHVCVRTSKQVREGIYPFIAALIEHVPITVVMYTSSGWAKIANYLPLYDSNGEKIERLGKIVFRDPAHNKGEGGQVIITDGMMDEDYFNTVVLPLLCNTRTCWLGLTGKRMQGVLEHTI